MTIHFSADDFAAHFRTPSSRAFLIDSPMVAGMWVVTSRLWRLRDVFSPADVKSFRYSTSGCAFKKLRGVPSDSCSEGIIANLEAGPA